MRRKMNLYLLEFFLLLHSCLSGECENENKEKKQTYRCVYIYIYTKNGKEYLNFALCDKKF